MLRRSVKSLTARFGWVVLRGKDTFLSEHVKRAYVACLGSTKPTHEQRIRMEIDLLKAGSLLNLSSMIKYYEIDCVIDVGANKGQFGKSLRDVGFLGEIYSFEPVSRMFEELQSRAAEDALWYVFNTGLGAREHSSDATIYEDDSFSSTLPLTERGKKLFEPYVATTGVERILISTMDMALGKIDLSRKNILLKSDTQGYDLEVLKGASRVLGLTTLVLCETSKEPIYANAANEQQIIAYLANSGFEPFRSYPIGIDSDLSVIESDTFFRRTPQDRHPSASEPTGGCQ